MVQALWLLAGLQLGSAAWAQSGPDDGQDAWVEYEHNAPAEVPSLGNQAVPAEAPVEGEKLEDETQAQTHPDATADPISPVPNSSTPPAPLNAPESKPPQPPPTPKNPNTAVPPVETETSGVTAWQSAGLGCGIAGCASSLGTGLPIALLGAFAFSQSNNALALLFASILSPAVGLAGMSLAGCLMPGLPCLLGSIQASKNGRPWWKPVVGAAPGLCLGATGGALSLGLLVLFGGFAATFSVYFTALLVPAAVALLGSAVLVGVSGPVSVLGIGLAEQYWVDKAPTKSPQAPVSASSPRAAKKPLSEPFVAAY